MKMRRSGLSRTASGPLPARLGGRLKPVETESVLPAILAAFRQPGGWSMGLHWLPSKPPSAATALIASEGRCGLWSFRRGGPFRPPLPDRSRRAAGEDVGTDGGLAMLAEVKTLLLLLGSDAQGD